MQIQTQNQESLELSVQNLRDNIDDFAKDIRINLGTVLKEGQSGLSENQIFGIALASAYATQNINVIENIKAEAMKILSKSEMTAAKSSASIMAMNNVYYRFAHLVHDKDYRTMSAGLRMNVIGQSGIDKGDFELYALAVSAINGCGMCMDAHVREVTKAGISKDGIQHSVKIASVITAAAQATSI
jgi:alkyl hydroperoxide reductase subunit D